MSHDEAIRWLGVTFLVIWALMLVAVVVFG